MARSRRRLACRVLAISPLTIGSASPLSAQGQQPDQIAQFYKGRTVTIVVGYTTGGAYDTHARITARHWTRYVRHTESRGGSRREHPRRRCQEIAKLHSRAIRERP